jgi:hypothetical protein
MADLDPSEVKALAFVRSSPKLLNEILDKALVEAAKVVRTILRDHGHELTEPQAVEVAGAILATKSSNLQEI